MRHLKLYLDMYRNSLVMRITVTEPGLYFKILFVFQIILGFYHTNFLLYNLVRLLFSPLISVITDSNLYRIDRTVKIVLYQVLVLGHGN